MVNKSLKNQAKNNVMEKLIKLTEKFPNKPWDWEELSNNENLTIEVIEKYIDKPWNWKKFSQNPNITM